MATRTITSAFALVFAVSCAPIGERVAPIPLASSLGDHVDVQGAIFTATAYVDPKQSEAAFGFDIRRAGLLPVRLSVDNQSQSVIKLNPQQTFLIDHNNQAWPVLTSEQAYNRVSRSIELETMARGGATSAGLLGAAGAIGGFALSVVLSRGIGTPTLQGATAGASVGAITGATDSLNSMENNLRRELSNKALRNQRILPGDLAHGVIFFPGKDEAKTARTLRLSIEMDSYPEVVTVPLKLPLPARPD